MPRQEPQKTNTISGYEAQYYDKVSSTNDMAKEIVKRTQEQKLVIIAETQTHARGRQGRQWISPRGGIWLSILLRPRIAPKEVTKITLITALAVAKTIKDTLGLEVGVKWPNDVLINGRKLCGILTETTTRADVVEYVVVGIGVNANIDLRSFPDYLRNSATTLEHELGREIDRDALTRNILESFEHCYKRLQGGMWDAQLREWKGLAKFLGEQVEVTSFAETVVGEALDIDTEGALVVKLENGLLKRIVVGDLKLKTLTTGG